MINIKETNKPGSSQYGDHIRIEDTFNTSDHSRILFGQDSFTGIEVTIKQQRGGNQKSLYRELSILMLIEEARHDSVKPLPICNTLEQYLYEPDGFPCFLGFDVRNNSSEILMAYAGQTVEQWQQQLVRWEDRLCFASTMIYQMVKTLEKLHSLGFTHCDIKGDNICAVLDPYGQLQFTLIDFGVSTNFRSSKQIKQRKSFKGNFLFASFDHISFGRADKIDDLISLVYLAFYFVHGSLPWEEMEEVKDDPKFVNSVEFARMRWVKRKDFMQEIANKKSPFRDLLKHLQRTQINLKNEKLAKELGEAECFIDYETILDLVPSSQGKLINHEPTPGKLFTEHINSIMEENSPLLKESHHNTTLIQLRQAMQGCKAFRQSLKKRKRKMQLPGINTLTYQSPARIINYLSARYKNQLLQVIRGQKQEVKKRLRSRSVQLYPHLPVTFLSISSDSKSQGKKESKSHENGKTQFMESTNETQFSDVQDMKPRSKHPLDMSSSKSQKQKRGRFLQKQSSPGQFFSNIQSRKKYPSENRERNPAIEERKVQINLSGNVSRNQEQSAQGSSQGQSLLIEEESKRQRQQVSREIAFKTKKEQDQKPKVKQPPQVSEDKLILKHGLYDLDLTNLDVDEHQPTDEEGSRLFEMEKHHPNQQYRKQIQQQGKSLISMGYRRNQEFSEQERR